MKNITFQIEEPQIIALVGPNGSGKTTMMNCLMNLLPFQEGNVTILGKNIAIRLYFMMYLICRTIVCYTET
ncbi:ATP-binding cassette domain-containing protein [Metasolibacillus meyeri]|uniref:ATP-binding cassette domain-containing protein n=1 Tax=Metasolibacillus meyeri TaxID=1071052 RepID=UPI003083142A